MPCPGTCYYQWDNYNGQYYLVYDTCPHLELCYCPNGPTVYQGEILELGCLGDIPASTTKSGITIEAPTTTTPTPCAYYTCRWWWSDTQTQWVLSWNMCEAWCDCPTPSQPGQYYGDEIEYLCVPK